MIATGTGTPIAIFVDVLRLVAEAEVDEGVAVDVYINVEVVGEEGLGVEMVEEDRASIVLRVRELKNDWDRGPSNSHHQQSM